MDPTDERAVARGLRGGDPDVWRAFYDAHAARVWRTVARLVGPSAADVSDVVQETFLAAAKSARQFDPDRGPLWGWLWGISRHCVVAHLRRRERTARLHEAYAGWLDGVADPPPDEPAARELADLVRLTLAELPADYGAVLTAKYLDGESVEAIAGRDGLSEVAVRSRLSRARQAFREAFGRHAGLAAVPGSENR